MWGKERYRKKLEKERHIFKRKISIKSVDI